MNPISLLGWLSSTLFVLTLWGSAHQVALLWNMLRTGSAGKFSNLSLPFFFAYFLGPYLFFAYSAFLTPPDYFIALTRAAASILALTLLFLLWCGRKDVDSGLAFGICALLFASAIASISMGFKAPGSFLQALKFMIFGISLYGVYAYSHQLRKIYSTRTSEGLSKFMNFLIILKDGSTIAYALALNLNESWPLLVQAAMNGSFRCILLYFCFRYDKKPGFRFRSFGR